MLLNGEAQRRKRKLSNERGSSAQRILGVGKTTVALRMNADNFQSIRFPHKFPSKKIIFLLGSEKTAVVAGRVSRISIWKRDLLETEKARKGTRGVPLHCPDQIVHFGRSARPLVSDVHLDRLCRTFF